MYMCVNEHLCTYTYTDLYYIYSFVLSFKVKTFLNKTLVLLKSLAKNVSAVSVTVNQPN